MDDRSIAAASDLLHAHWTGGRRLAALPETLRPRTRAEGYAIQAMLERRSPEPIVGWKIAATSEAGQRHINVGGPMLGRLLAERCHPDGAMRPFGANAMAVAEAEFCFRMGRTLPPRDRAYAVAEVVDAVAALHLAIEIPDSRYEDFTAVGEAQLIADNACAHEFVLGPEVTADWRSADLAGHRVTGRVVGGQERQGLGANVLGDPRIALAFAANELSRLGLALEAGRLVTTGTCLVPIPIGPGDAVLMDFGTFGRVSVSFERS